MFVTEAGMEYFELFSELMQAATTKSDNGNFSIELKDVVRFQSSCVN